MQDNSLLLVQSHACFYLKSRALRACCANVPDADSRACRRQNVLVDVIDMMEKKGTHHLTLIALAGCLVAAAESTASFQVIWIESRCTASWDPSLFSQICSLHCKQHPKSMTLSITLAAA